MNQFAQVQNLNAILADLKRPSDVRFLAFTVDLKLRGCLTADKLAFSCYGYRAPIAGVIGLPFRNQVKPAD
ncbi:MAG TPA: hypothetical protein VGR94_07530 [Candidatus Acidoferrales bacterium]|nr:hypothetical protein [Candidatus Acidoferrales bacterium]